MNNMKKIGLSALAGSLVAFSVNAAEMSASGGAALYFSNADTKSTTNENNQWTMGDSITMTASGELDNGMTVSASYEIDNDDTGGGSVYDSHSMTVSGDFGTITFAGHGGSTAMSAVDDITPNAYEESWDVVTNADQNNVNGLSGDNSFLYTSPDMGGATIKVGYLPSDDTTTDVSYMDFGIEAAVGMVDGLTVGFAMGETEAVSSTVIDDQTMYVKYTTGPITAAYQMSESDGAAGSSDIEFEAMGVSYAVSDDFTIAYNVSSHDQASTANDQEATGISLSYTMGGITLAGAMNDVDNVGFNSTSDTDGYEFGLSFAF